MITGWSKWILQWKYCTDMQEKVKARLCESPPRPEGARRRDTFMSVYGVLENAILQKLKKIFQTAYKILQFPE